MSPETDTRFAVATNDPSPVLVRLNLRYPDLDAFVARFAPNVTRGGVFLASRKPRPVGEVIRFEIALAQGSPVLWGSGRVTWVREFNPAEPHRAHGMGVQFTFLDPECRPLLDRLLERKKAVRLTPVSGVPIVLPRQTSAASLAARGSATSASPDGPDEWADDTAVRRAADRARMLLGGTDEIESLLQRTPDEPTTLEQALADLPRLISNRRTTAAINVSDDPGANKEGTT
ncbi:MAG TPA: PilZ domain-containing protein [Polyangia bacterium]|nr:PilZ domain-containing protein [Polyangia bacterium]